MKTIKSIQIKAAFLMIVFSLNTIIGFACAVGIDMSFNSPHHHDEDATDAIVHTHKDGKKHIHQEEPKHHEEAENDHHKKDSKDDCCNDKVLKISQSDKAVPQAVKLSNPVFFIAFVSIYSDINISYQSKGNISTKYFVRGHHSPIPDIRLAIRSFQI